MTRRLQCSALLFVLFLCCCPIAQPQSCTTAPPGIVGWWPGDSNENDIVGGNNPSSVVAVTLVPGEVRNGFTFGTDGYIEIPESPDLENQQFTWAAWVKPDGPGPNNDSYGSVIVEQNIDDIDASVWLSWSATGNRFVFGFGNLFSELITSTGAFPAGTFYFVAATYDGSTFQLFVNGVLEGSFAEAKTVAYSSLGWEIGSNPTIYFPTLARTWNGVIDEVQAYNSALSASQIQAIYNAGSGGVCKGLTFSPARLKFPRRTVGTTSPALAVTVTNAFPLPVTINHIAANGDFAQTNTCPVSPATLASGAPCQLNVTFAPTATGARTGRVAFVHSAPASPQIVSLSGAATDVSLSPAALRFSHQVVGTASAVQTVTATNVGTATVNFTGSGIVVAGSDAADFIISTATCGTSLAGGATCTVGIEFQPTSGGSRNAALQFNDDGGASPQTVALTGAATDVSLSATSLRFGSHKVGTTSAAQTVTVTNAGSATVNFTGTGIVIAGAEPADFVISANTCGSSLPSAAECTVSVEFKPTNTGARSATLQFNDDGGASPQTVALAGKGL